MSTRKLYLVCLSLMCMGIIIGCRKQPGSKKIRNILLISIDTCRADYLSCYGHTGQTTPTIDAVAQEGILYENVVTTIPLTLPAHSSMFTGTIPPYHSVHDNIDYKLDKSNVTLAEVLQQEGFVTGAIISAFVLDSRFGLAQGFKTYDDQFDYNQNNVFSSERIGDEASRHTNAWLEKNRDERFFLFLHYYDAHYPWIPPEPFKSSYASDPYAGEVAYVDHCIRLVLDKLKSLGLYDSTMIIVTADHGESLEEHGEITHGDFIYQSTLKIPLILRIPGGPRGVKVRERTGVIDIFPTICSILGIECPSQIQGKDISHYFSKRSYPEKERLFYCESLLPTQYDCNPLVGLIDKDFKYIRTTRPELYNLRNDPKELNNLANEQPKKAHIMQEKLEQIIETQLGKQKIDSKLLLDAESISRLESLGYVAGVTVDDSYEFNQSKDDPKDIFKFHLLNAAAAFKLDEGKDSEVRQICDEMLKLKPDFPMTYHMLGKLAFAKGDYEEAVEHYSKQVELDPQAYGGYNNLGLTLSRLGRLDEAIDCFKKSVGINPYVFPETHALLARAFRLQGKFDKAIAQIHKALKIAPDEERFKTGLKEIVSSREKFDKAVKELKSNPDSAEAHYNMAGIYYNQKKLDLAAEYCQKALKINPDYIKARTSLAGTLFELNRKQSALKQYYLLLESDPDSVNTLNPIAWILSTNEETRLNNSAEAVKFAIRACELTDYNEPQIIDTLGAAYAADGKFGQAIEAAQKAIELATSSDKKDLAEEIGERLELYKQGRPYNEP